MSPSQTNLLLLIIVLIVIAISFLFVFFSGVLGFTKHPIYHSKCVGNHTGVQTTEGNTSFQTTC